MNLIKRLRAARSRLSTRTRRGIAALEFALTLPLWTTMLLGTSDGVYCLMINEKADRIAYTVTDIVTQYQIVTLANLNDIVQAAGQLMKPFAFGNNGVVVVSSIYKPAGLSPIVEWQYKGGGSLVQGSQIGNIGGTAKLPNGLTLNDNDNVIVSEVFYNFKPMFLSTGLFPASLVYRTGVYKPRLSQLTTAPS